jgi:hypothetical protein
MVSQTCRWKSVIRVAAVCRGLSRSRLAGGLFALALMLPAGAQAADSKALGLSWKGHADTSLAFSQSFGADHTIVLRFMPQYANAYEGPVVAENGPGRFVIGQGDWLSGPSGTKLYLGVGSQ